MMKKSILVAFLLISSILLISIAKADWMDEFFGPKVDPSLSPVDVGVTVENSFPSIKRFFLIPASVGPTTQQPFTPLIIPGIGGGGEWYIGLVGEDPDGANDLPIGIPVTNTFAEIHAPASSVNPSITRQAVAYAGYDCSETSLAGICDNPSRQRVYLAQGVYLSSDPHSTYSPATPNINDVWTISATITDSVGHTSALYSTPVAEPLTEGVQINQVTAAFVSGIISFTTINLAGTNQLAATYPEIQNYGNTPLSEITITAADLQGADPGAILAASGFSAGGLNGVSPNQVCNVPLEGAALQNGVGVIIPNSAVQYTAQGWTVDKKQIPICLRTVVTSGPPSSTYGGSWDMSILSAGGGDV